MDLSRLLKIIKETSGTNGGSGSNQIKYKWD